MPATLDNHDSRRMRSHIGIAELEACTSSGERKREKAVKSVARTRRSGVRAQMPTDFAVVSQRMREDEALGEVLLHEGAR